MIYLPWKASKARLREAENARDRVTRRELIKRGLMTTGALLIAKTMSASAEAPARTTSRARRAPMGRAKPASWRTQVRIIEK